MFIMFGDENGKAWTGSASVRVIESRPFDWRICRYSLRDVELALPKNVARRTNVGYF